MYCFGALAAIAIDSFIAWVEYCHTIMSTFDYCEGINSCFEFTRTANVCRTPRWINVSISDGTFRDSTKENALTQLCIEMHLIGDQLHLIRIVCFC